MIKLREAVIVEGRYDKIKLSGLIDALVIPTNGYRIFKDKKALATIRELGLSRGLIILTDSDAAGFRIRRHLQGAVPTGCITHVYLPQIAGRESRKEKPSAEGLLGVEGVSDAVILEAFEKAGIHPLGTEAPAPAGRPVTKTDFVMLGLSGAPDSGARRQAVLSRLGMPGYLTSGAMIDIINATMDYEALVSLCRELFN